MQEEIKNIKTINISVAKKQKTRRHCEEPKGFGDEAIQPILFEITNSKKLNG